MIISGDKIKIYLFLILFGHIFTKTSNSFAIEVPKEISYKSACYPLTLRFKKLEIEEIRCADNEHFPRYGCEQLAPMINNVLVILKDEYNKSITSLKTYKYISNISDYRGPHVCQAGPGWTVFLVSVDFNEKVQIPFILKFREEVLKLPKFSDETSKLISLDKSEFVFTYESPKNWPGIRILKVNDSVLIFYYLVSDADTVTKIIDKIKG